MLINEYLNVLKEIHRYPKRFQSDFVRYNAKLIAESASRGHISCVFGEKVLNEWFITAKGLTFLKDNGGYINEIEDII